MTALHIAPADLATRTKSRNACSCRRWSGCLGSKRRRTVSTFESFYGTGDDSAIGSIGLVANNIAEIVAIAKVAGIRTRASES